MLTEGFPTTDAHGARANSLVELKLRRESFDNDQNANQKGSYIKNHRDYLVKKS